MAGQQVDGGVAVLAFRALPQPFGQGQQLGLHQPGAHQCGHRRPAHWRGHAQKFKLVFHVGPHRRGPFWVGQGLQGLPEPGQQGVGHGSDGETTP